MSFILALIGHIFWIEEYQYSFDRGNTDIQVNYCDFQNSSIPVSIGHPLYIHFYDPECKYSKINIDHIAPVMAQYENEIDYFILVKGAVDVTEFRQRYNLPDHVNVVNDPSEEFYSKLKVDRTPNVALIDRDFNLYFTGNYTSGLAFCGTSNIRNSNPAMALKFLINDNPAPIFPTTKSYSCKF